MLIGQARPLLSPEQEEVLERKKQEEREALGRFQEERRRFLVSPKLKIESAKEVQPSQTGMKKSKKKKDCYQIHNIYIVGDPDLAKGDADRLVKGWKGHCLGKPEFTVLLRKITDYYKERGYISTRAYLAPQDLRSGELRIKIVLAKIGSIAFAEEKQGAASEIFTAFPFFSDSHLYLPFLEQGIERLNSLPSKRVALDIEESQADGTTDILIRNPSALYEKIWRTSLQLDNSGTGLSGKEMATFNLELDSPLLLNDHWNLSIQKNIKALEPGNRNLSRSLQCRFPFGYLQTSVFLSHFEYENTIRSNLSQIKNSGNTNTQNLLLEAVIHRTQHAKTLLGYGYKERRSQNFINDVPLELSSRSIKNNSYSLSHSRSFEKGYINLSLSYEQGKVSVLEGVPQTLLDPSLAFEKVNLRLSYSLTFQFFKESFTWKFSFFKQMSEELLFSGEQLGLGGLYSVRGFKEQSLSGDQGLYARNELHWKPSFLSRPQVWLLWGLPSFFLAYDIGTVKRNAKDLQGSGGQLEGLALGLSHQSPYSQFYLTYSRSMRWAHLEKEEAIWLSLTLKY